MMARNLKRGSKVCYVIGEWPDCSAILKMAASVLDFFTFEDYSQQISLIFGCSIRSLK